MEARRLRIRAYYYAWQMLARQRALALARTVRFDVVHHTTFANLWLPALAGVAGVPFVFGPVSGGQRVPLQLYPTLGARATALELSLLLARLASRVNPLVHVAWRRASVIVVNNLETLAAVPRPHRDRVVVRSNAVVELPDVGGDHGDADGQVASSAEPLAVCAGRLSPFKGVALAVQSLAYAPAWRLLVVGDGSERPRLERLAEELAVADRVRFVPTLAQEQLWQTLRRCRALVLPSLKEGASFVAAEAQALGVPVVAFGRGGPAVLGLFPETTFHFVEVGSQAETARRIGAALRAVAETPRPRSTRVFGIDGVARDLEVLYELTRRPQVEWPALLAGRETAVMLPGQTRRP